MLSVRSKRSPDCNDVDVQGHYSSAKEYCSLEMGNLYSVTDERTGSSLITKDNRSCSYAESQKHKINEIVVDKININDKYCISNCNEIEKSNVNEVVKKTNRDCEEGKETFINYTELEGGHISETDVMKGNNNSTEKHDVSEANCHQVDDQEVLQDPEYVLSQSESCGSVAEPKESLTLSDPVNISSENSKDQRGNDHESDNDSCHKDSNKITVILSENSKSDPVGRNTCSPNKLKQRNVEALSISPSNLSSQNSVRNNDSCGYSNNKELNVEYSVKEINERNSMSSDHKNDGPKRIIGRAEMICKMAIEQLQSKQNSDSAENIANDVKSVDVDCILESEVCSIANSSDFHPVVKDKPQKDDDQLKGNKTICHEQSEMEQKENVTQDEEYKRQDPYNDLNGENVERICIPDQVLEDGNTESCIDENISNCESSSIALTSWKNDEGVMPFVIDGNESNECSVETNSIESSDRNIPVFCRGTFPRIVIKDTGIQTIKRLQNHVLKFREKREKKERMKELKSLRISNRSLYKKLKQRSVAENELSKSDNFCDGAECLYSTKKMKLKCLRICLEKIDENTLSKYNLSLPNCQIETVFPKNREGSKVDSQVEIQVKVPGDVQREYPVEKLLQGMKNSGHVQERKTIDSSEEVSDTELSVIKSDSDLKRRNKRTCLEKIHNDLIEKDLDPMKIEMNLEKRENLCNAMDNITKLQRNNLDEILSHIQKPMQSDVKMARVHILKLDDQVLSKYGYNSKNLKIDPILTNFSDFMLNDDKDNTKKIISNLENNQKHLHQSVHVLLSKIDDVYPSVKEQSVKINMPAASKSDTSKKISIQNKTNRKFRNMKSNSERLNIKASKVIIKRTNDFIRTRSEKKLLMKSYTSNLKKSLGQERNIKHSTITLRNAKMLVKNYESTPRSRCILLTKTNSSGTPKATNTRERSVKVAMKDSNTRSLESIQENSTTNKTFSKISSHKVDVQDRKANSYKYKKNNSSNVNLSLNGESMYLKRLKVNLIKLDSVSAPEDF